jgi:hypothetical protein
MTSSLRPPICPRSRGEHTQASAPPVSSQLGGPHFVERMRLPTLADVADAAAFVASDRAGAMTATVVNLSAGSITD